MRLTEERNPESFDIDLLDTEQILLRINAQDQRVAPAVASVIPDIARAVDGITSRLRSGGRLFYVGAGTSGRLGILDAVECPPTYNTPPDVIQGILAGGYEACYRSIEAAEDDPEAGERDLLRAGLKRGDAVVGIAASGRTPYTCGAVARARREGAFTVGISCNRNTPLSREAEVAIEVETGPEIVTGSTRMKAGTAQKLILNMISTTTMIRLGYVYSNLMINVHLKNSKLVERGIRIVQEITGASREEAKSAIEESQDVKTAIVMVKENCSPDQARRILDQYETLREAFQHLE
ncbi:MAG TPA: N-acetylmuramic acid 6-phosphate etherase [Acidobacteriota bacterium]|nr:N-acetylmuramic acid 6-phosphate etherase [Acidobacteriota bacterium]